MNSLHANASALLSTWVPPSQDQARLRDRYVTHLRNHPDALDRSCFPDHLTAGAIVVSPAADAVLLNHHRKADAWLAFGGHVESSDLTLAGAARRELVEESGLKSFWFDSEPLSLDAHAVDFCSPRGTVHHLDVRFLAIAERDDSHVTSDESLEVRWWPAEALPKTFDDMYPLIEAAVAKARQRSSSTASSRAAAE